ncbi:hypothetical protein [Caldicoprobacter faecalis]|uniref:Uncharacterized protein n=1 Tax=Caldicoprobacter faecalis TaxID=937334 RepID=A0A1I5WUI7_9FIRM|nr:hypothetical protein [Caldicoprobacter faecalis]SFQ23176.1 hypothetical protein SAMN05444406_11932 [Caldicoprobacter faecalis]
MSVDLRLYDEAVKDIFERTGGDIDKMTITDLVTLKQIALITLEYVNNILENQYDVLLAWANFDIDEYILRRKEADYATLSRLLGLTK